MNRIEITTGPDGKGWVVHQDGKNSGILCYGEMLEQVIALMPPYDGKHYPMRTDAEWEAGWRRMAKPDRITITLTEREAELVMLLAEGGPDDGDIYAIWDALFDARIRLTDYTGPFDFDAFPKGQAYGDDDNYAHASRVDYLMSSDEIRLTMDRDVAVTLRHLLDCVKPKNELAEVIHKLREHGVVGAVVSGIPQRFTGTIRWKKRRLNTFECEEGKTYRLVKKPGKNATGKAHRMEWEPVEE